MGDEVIDIDLPVHVPVDNLGNISAPLCPAKSRPFPNTSSYQLKRARRNLFTGTGNANDNTLPPAFVAALERLAHYLYLTDALKTVVRTAPGKIHEIWYKISFYLPRIHKVRHSELLCERLLFRIYVNSDDAIRPDHSAPLNHIKANTPKSKNDNVRTGLNLCRIDNCADSRGDSASNIADLVERVRLPEL